MVLKMEHHTGVAKFDATAEDIAAVLDQHPEIAEQAGWTRKTQGWEHVFAMQERRPERLRQLLRDRVKILYEELCLYEDTDLDEIMILVSNTGPWLDAACEALLAEGSE